LTISTKDELLTAVEPDQSAILIIEYYGMWFDYRNPEKI
jgi:hypothetical protein